MGVSNFQSHTDLAFILDNFLTSKIVLPIPSHFAIASINRSIIGQIRYIRQNGNDRDRYSRSEAG